MKTFRYYLDIDAKDRDDAQSQLEENAASMSFGDLDFIEMPCETITTEELKKFFDIKEDSETLGKIQDLFEGWDGWFCCVDDCGETVGCDTGDMFEHLKTHTIEELQEALK